MNPIGAFHSLFRELLDQPVSELVLRLTLLTLVLHGSSTTWLDVPLKVLCGFMLVSRTHFREPFLWIVICVLTWWINASDWLWIDNHKYLISYWVLVCTLAVSSDEAEEAILSWNGRVLVGLTFGFATLWKGIAGEYWNGDFFFYTLLMDGRMEFIAHTFGGVSKADLAQARMIENVIEDFPSETIQAGLPASGRLQLVAFGMAWWTILIEAAVAVSFLVTKTIMEHWRHWVLLVFIGATYVFVPVLGFGYILTILGLAACRVDQPVTRCAYLVVIVILQLGRLPWESLIG